MLKSKKIAAWVLALTVPFGMSTSFSNQAFAKKHYKGDVYINVKSKGKRSNEDESTAKSVLRGIFTILGLTFLGIVCVAAADEDSDNYWYSNGSKKRKVKYNTGTGHISYTETTYQHRPNNTGRTAAAAFCAGACLGAASNL